MTRIDENTTLGELVNAHPQLARELEHRGLDYCCRGGRTLAEACDKAGLDQRALVTELTALTRRPTVVEDWTTMTATELVDHIVTTHHQNLWAELPRLTDLVEKVARVHSASHPELREVEAVFDDLRTDLEPHMLKEERVLFPMIRELSIATVAPTFHCGKGKGRRIAVDRKGNTLAHQVLVAPSYRFGVNVDADQFLACRRNEISRQATAPAAEIENSRKIGERPVNTSQQTFDVPINLSPDAKEMVGVFPATDSDTKERWGDWPGVVVCDQVFQFCTAFAQSIALLLKLREALVQIFFGHL